MGYFTETTKEEVRKAWSAIQRFKETFERDYCFKHEGCLGCPYIGVSEDDNIWPCLCTYIVDKFVE